MNNEEATRSFGKRLGELVTGIEVIEFIGDVGAGKTTLVRGLAEGMGVDETVQSPSFTISRLYTTPSGRRLAHYDFYRLADPGIMADELTETIGTHDTVVVIEWAAAVAAVLPDDRLTIRIGTNDTDSRELDLIIGGPSSQALLERLA